MAAEFFLAERDGRPVGRVAAIHNRAHNEFCQDTTGFFGFFETEDDPATAGRSSTRRPPGAPAGSLTALQGRSAPRPTTSAPSLSRASTARRRS